MKIARLAISRPRLVLLVWLTLVGLLALRGVGVEDRLHRGAITVPGSAATANAVGEKAFGQGVPLTILLRGPRGELDRQGPELVRALGRVPDARVLSPWTTADSGTGGALRPRADRALIVVRQDAPFERQSRVTVPRLRALLRERVDAPVRAHLTGAPDVANGIQKASLEALGRAELIAAPLLLLVLLFVFRSPVAAAIPLMMGMFTIGAARGVIDLVNGFVALDSLALSIASTLGLALGVDYALLVVSRFREELAEGGDVRQAATVAAERAGHTVFMAGLALAAATVTSLVLAPGSLLASATAGALVAAGLTVSAAITVLPAVLMLAGGAVNRWRFGGTAVAGRGAAVALAALRRPVIAAAGVGGLLVLLAVPALGLQTGPPDVRGLPAGSAERQDYEAIRAALGGGWMAPFDVVVVAKEGPITTPARMHALERFQAGIARLREVDTVFGPATLAPAERRLAEIPRTLRRAQGDQARLAGGMRRVRNGVGRLRAGLGEAAAGAAALRVGGARAGDGARRLERGLAQAQEGAVAVVGGLARADAGSGELAHGVTAALRGARRLAAGADRLRSGATEAHTGAARLASGLRDGRAGLAQLREPAQIADRELARALESLDAMLATSKLDPAYRRVYEAVGTASAAVSGRDPRDDRRVREGYDGLDASLATAASRLDEAVTGAERLRDGLARLGTGLATLDRGIGSLRAGIGSLRAGAQRLRTGLARLRAGGGELEQGLAALRRGARALDTGTARLAGGAQRLADGLGDGAARSAQLGSGVTRISDGVAGSRALGDADQLIRVTRSGHTLLAALESAPRAQRDAAGLIVNLERGGQAADITVIARHDPSRAGEPLRARLEAAAARFSERTGLRAVVGGSAPVFQDFDKVSSERLPLLIAGLVALTYLALVAIFRSIVLPAIAVLLNAGTVLAAFGVLALLFQGDDPVLGGPGFLDAISVFGTLSVVFGLSIDYAVFLVARMREGYALTGTTEGAVTYAVNGTARIITGAAMIMSGVFLALAVSDVSNLRQLGVGLTVAVMLDATLVRLVLLPALVKLAGPAAWWFPTRIRGGAGMPHPESA